MPESDLILPRLEDVQQGRNNTDGAYSYYNSLLKTLNSFCNGLELASYQ
jgi:hypothetical protein